MWVDLFAEFLDVLGVTSLDSAHNFLNVVVLLIKLCHLTRLMSYEGHPVSKRAYQQHKDRLSWVLVKKL